MGNDQISFWSTPLFSSGFMMGIGMGFVCSMISVQLPNNFIGRTSQVLFVAGIVTFVPGALRLIKYLAANRGR